MIMSWKWMRGLITFAAVVGIFIFSVRGIKLDPAVQTAPMPSVFTLRMDGNTWACTMTGTVVNCIYRAQNLRMHG